MLVQVQHLVPIIEDVMDKLVNAFRGYKLSSNQLEEARAKLYEMKDKDSRKAFEIALEKCSKASVIKNKAVREFLEEIENNC